MASPRSRPLTSARLQAACLAALSLSVSVACRSGAGSPVPRAEPGSVVTAPSPVSSPGGTPRSVAAASPSPGAPDTLVALAVADAAQRTGAAVSEVTVERVEPREWPDRSLGCPMPGVGYAQVITPGYVIVVQARGQRFEYHADQAQVTLCTA